MASTTEKLRAVRAALEVPARCIVRHGTADEKASWATALRNLDELLVRVALLC